MASHGERQKPVARRGTQKMSQDGAQGRYAGRALAGGRYQLRDLLGEGGMASVHLAYDSESGDGATGGIFGIGAHVALKAPIGM